MPLSGETDVIDAGVMPDDITTFSVPDFLQPDVKIDADPPDNPDDPEQTGVRRELDRTSTAVTMPYRADGHMFKLFNNNGSLLDGKNIGYLAKVCGDQICQAGETPEDCPEDCRSAPGEAYEQLPAPKERALSVYYIAGIFIFLIITVIILITKKSRKQDLPLDYPSKK